MQRLQSISSAVVVILTLAADILTLAADILTLAADILALAADILTLAADILALVADILTLAADILTLVAEGGEEGAVGDAVDLSVGVAGAAPRRNSWPRRGAATDKSSSCLPQIKAPPRGAFLLLTSPFYWYKYCTLRLFVWENRRLLLCKNAMKMEIWRDGSILSYSIGVQNLREPNFSILKEITWCFLLTIWKSVGFSLYKNTIRDTRQDGNLIQHINVHLPIVLSSGR